MTLTATTLQNYQELALRTEAPLPTLHARMDHAILGLITETGEFCTQVKRIAIYGKTLDDLEKDGKCLRVHAAEELGDAMWYVAIASDALGLNVFPLLSIENQAYSLGAVARKLAKINGNLATAFEDPTLWRRQPSLLRDMWDTLVNAAGLIGVPIEHIAADNIAKLAARYPDKFSAEAAEARADKGGLDARNS